MEDIKDKLIHEARKKGICVDGYKDMNKYNLDKLIDYYIKNPDWCLERDFPNLQMLSESFADIQDKGIYVNKSLCGNVLNNLQTYIFHNCKGVVNTRLNIEKCIIPMFYFANGCDMLIHCDERIKIPIYVFGENKIKTSGIAQFKIYKTKMIEKGGEL